GLPLCSGQMSRRTKIICTVGPASDSPEALEALVRAGMDVARLNFSHGSQAEHALRLQRVREAARKVGRAVAALQDLCGPKIRTGSFPRGAYVLSHEGKVTLVEGAAAPEEPDTIPIQYEGLA